MKPKRVVVVCLANQCRSPMAEFLLAAKLQAVGAQKQVEVSSAGIEATPGLPATRAARSAVERRYGKDFLKGHRASRLTPAIIGETDLVLVMTRGQKALLIDEWSGVIPGAESKIQTLGEFAGQAKVDVDDPVGGPDARYEKCLDLLDDLTTAAARKLAGEDH